MPEIAYVNGEFLPLERAMVHVEDRGFQFADVVYEVMRLYGGNVFALEDHLRRLFRRLAEISLETGFTPVHLGDVINEAVHRSGFADAAVYLQITRGRAKRHRGLPSGITPTLVITVRELPPPSATLSDKGIALVTTEDVRWARCDLKTVG